VSRDMNERLRKKKVGRRRRHDEEDRLPLRPAAGDIRQATSPAAVARLLRRAKDEPEASALAPVVAVRLRGLQASRGNQYVQRLVSEAGARRPSLVNGRATPPSPVAKSGLASIQRKKAGSLLLGEEPLMDPAVKAKLEALQAAMEALDPAKTKAGLLSLPLGLKPPPPWLAPLTPEELAGEKPLVKAGAGPREARAATGEDLLKALVATGVFDRPLGRLREKATRDFRRLKPGEKALLITTSAVIGSAVLAGVISDQEGRKFALDQLDGLNPAVPGVPGLSVRFTAKPGKLGAMLMYKTSF
jgi:hypothetical protein